MTAAKRARLDRRKRAERGGAPQQPDVRSTRQGPLPMLVQMAKHHPLQLGQLLEFHDQGVAILEADGIPVLLTNRDGWMMQG